jgi:hypothetical protein
MNRYKKSLKDNGHPETNPKNNEIRDWRKYVNNKTTKYNPILLFSDILIPLLAKINIKTNIIISSNILIPGIGEE